MPFRLRAKFPMTGYSMKTFSLIYQNDNTMLSTIVSYAKNVFKRSIKKLLLALGIMEPGSHGIVQVLVSYYIILGILYVGSPPHL